MDIIDASIIEEQVIIKETNKNDKLELENKEVIYN